MKKLAFVLTVLALTLCLAAAAAGRCPGFFLREEFTRSEALTEIPGESSTRAYPAAAKRKVYAENENAVTVLLRPEGEENPIPCFIVPEGPARIRIEISAADDPDNMICGSLLGSPQALADLLDPERGVFVREQATEGAYGGAAYHFNAGLLADRALLTADPGLIAYFVTADEAYLEEIEEALRLEGAGDIRRETGEPVRDEDAPQAYILHVKDQNGAPVPGVYVSFCTDTMCVPAQSDENGTVVFSGAPETYHVQILRVPDGFSFDAGFEMVTGNAYGEWMLRIRKN